MFAEADRERSASSCWRPGSPRTSRRSTATTPRPQRAQPGAAAIAPVDAAVARSTTRTTRCSATRRWSRSRRHYLPAYLAQPRGLGRPRARALLAVAAACAGERAAPPAERYLKEWYGKRAAQGKALIGMLAWVEHPSATQLMLSIGSRFRTKSFQDEATRQAEALAERKGWTVAELADRTIPTAGFDDDGRARAVLRRAHVHRAAAARPHRRAAQPRGQDGQVRSRPPRQTDDADQAKDAKKALTAAKKELKARRRRCSSERLYEALCTERTGRRGLAALPSRHPVMRLLVQRLVWVATTDDADGDAAWSFRPLDDGTLTDVDDERGRPSRRDGARAARARHHPRPPSRSRRWQQHLADYEVAPAVPAARQGTCTLPDEGRRAGRRSTTSRGHLARGVRAARPRRAGSATPAGATEDGGWFHAYVKRFPTLGLVAEIEFTGNGLPEENRTVALLAARFERERPTGRARRRSRSATSRPCCCRSRWHDCARSPPRAPASTPTGRRRVLMMTVTHDVLRAPAEVVYAAELATPRASADRGPRPDGWRLSPRAVRTFVVGDDQARRHPQVLRRRRR